MKKIISIFLFLISVSFASAYELSDYPGFFLDGNIPDLILVGGDKAPASHVIAQTEIVVSLGTEFGQPLSGLNKLASEVEGIEDLNIISIGNACENNVTAEILGNPEPCNRDIPKGKALIQLLESKNNKVHIVLSSDSEKGIRKAAEVLSNFKDYTFSGSIYEIEIEEEAVNEEEEQEKISIIEEGDETGSEENTGVNEDIEQEKSAEEKGNIRAQEGILKDSEEGPEPVYREEDDLLKIIINWFKSLFMFWKK